MNVTINGLPNTLADGTTVADVLGGAPASCAVAVNGSVVPRSAHDQTPLHDGDAVEIVTAVAGG